MEAMYSVSVVYYARKFQQSMIRNKFDFLSFVLAVIFPWRGVFLVIWGNFNPFAQVKVVELPLKSSHSHNMLLRFEWTWEIYR
jgi:hypothetical protein